MNLVKSLIAVMANIQRFPLETYEFESRSGLSDWCFVKTTLASIELLSLKFQKSSLLYCRNALKTESYGRVDYKKTIHSILC